MAGPNPFAKGGADTKAPPFGKKKAKPLTAAQKRAAAKKKAAAKKAAAKKKRY
jgi:hypothetical protein